MGKVKEGFFGVTGLKWDHLDSMTLDDMESTSCGSSCCVDTEITLFRDMLLLMNTQYKHGEDERNRISANLSYLIIRRDMDGLRKLISASFDLDESSQKSTTFDQRFAAFGSLVSLNPNLCCPLLEYYSRLTPQVHSLFLSSVNTNNRISESVQTSLRKIGTCIINSMMTRNRKMMFRCVIQPLHKSLRAPSEDLTINNSLDVIYGLVTCNFDVKMLHEVFPHVFYARCIFENSLSVYKSKLDTVIQEMITRIDNSYHMMDACLFFNYARLHDLYQMQTDVMTGSVQLVFNPDKNNTSQDQNDLDIKEIDTVTQVASNTIMKHTRDEDKVNFCILLLNHLPNIFRSGPSVGLLLCSILSCLLEKMEDVFHKHPSLSIQFVIETLKHSSSDDSKDDVDVTTGQSSMSEDDADAVNGLMAHSISTAFQILQIILSDKQKVSIL